MKTKLILLTLLLTTSLQAQTSFKADVRGKGRPMILIPGLSSPGEVWDGTIVHFEHRFECHRLTLAGFAGQKPIDGPLLATVRRELADYIRAKKLDKPVIVGHSLGGFLAFWLAAIEPDLVGPIVAVDGLPYAPAVMGAITPEQIDQMSTYVASQTPEQFAMSTRMSLGMMITRREDLDRVAAAAVKSDAATAARAMREVMTTDLRAEVAKIRVPVLLIGAGGAREAYAKQIASIPNHELVMAKDAKHFVMLDAPEWFYATLERFLQ